MTRELSRAFRYLVPYWRRLALVVFISLASTGVSLAVPFLTRDLIDEALLGRNMAALQRLVGWFLALGVLGFILNTISGLRYTRVSAEILFDMRLALYAHLQRLSPRFYARTRLGDIVSRINNDIGEIQRIAAEAALAWVGNVLFLVGSVAMLVYLDWRLALVSAAGVPPALLSITLLRRVLERRIKVMRERSSEIGSFLIETLQASTLVVTSNAQPREQSRFRRLNDSFIEALMTMQKVSYLVGGLPGLLFSGASAVVFLYGGSRVVDGTLTLGTFAAFLAYQMRVLAPAQALMGLYAGLATARVSWHRVLEVLDARVDVVEAENAAPLKQARGRMAFESVTVTTERGVKVLDNVSFTVEPGETVALVGPSGIGKSTIAHLMARLIDPDEGVVRLDDQDVKSLRLSDLRRFVVLVEQEPPLLHASIAENLRYVRQDATDAEIAEAARAAGIGAFIDRMPQGFGTTVGERGHALSAGERQRIAIARAFLAKPAVLILDEPTAALDAESERQVVAGYQRAMAGKTVVIITHRPSVAEAAGRVIDVGAPALG